MEENKPMILFFGPENRGDWIREAVRKRGDEVRIIPAKGKVAEHVEEALAFPCNFMVFDVEQYTDPAEILAGQITRLSGANNAEVIAYAPGYSVDSQIVSALLQAQVRRFILSTVLADQKVELAQCLEGRYELPGKKAEESNLRSEGNETQEHVSVQTVGVVGVLPRIGVTTQALQIIKYLQFHGCRACYIEMNSHQYVEQLLQWMGNAKREDALGNAVYGNVDLFYDGKKLQNARKQGYEYYVYDYGAYQERGFQKESFLEKDLQVVVCGSSPPELSQTLQVLKNTFYDEARYLFSLTPEADWEDLLAMMEEKAERTYFSTYTPDPFVFSGAETYQKLLPLEGRRREKPERKGFFWRKGKRRS